MTELLEHRDSEEQQIEHIKSSFSLLLPQYSHIPLVVDLEGVVLPYGISTPDLMHDPLARYAVKRLPPNRPLLSLIRKLVNMDQEKVAVVSGSQLDVYRQKAQVEILPPAVTEALYRGHDLLHEAARDSFTDITTQFPAKSLFIFLNDLTTPDGNPPLGLLSFVQQSQKNASASSMLSVPIPEFNSDNASGYNQKLYKSIQEVMQLTPRLLK